MLELSDISPETATERRSSPPGVVGPFSVPLCFDRPEASSGILSQRHPTVELSAGLTSSAADCVSRLVPALLCGEESAICVFQREGVSPRAADAAEASRRVLHKIQREEEVHSVLLARLLNELPVAPDLATLRRRSRAFFIRMGVTTPSVVLSRVVEIDSAVCIILHAILAPHVMPGALHMKPLWTKIRREEAQHVRSSQAYLDVLGVKTPPDSVALAREGLVELLSGVADSFEGLGVDADRLFRRIRERGRNDLSACA